MTLLKVEPDKTYGRSFKDVAYDVDVEVFDLPPDRALYHIVNASEDAIKTAISHYTKQGWDVDYGRNPRYFKSPLQLVPDDVPAIDAFTKPETHDAGHFNSRISRTGKVQWVARIYFKKVLFDLLPRPEELLGEHDGFVPREEVEAFVPDQHKTWKGSDVDA